MAQQYGTVKVDNITFTSGGGGSETDITLVVSGLNGVSNSGITVTGTISGETAEFVSGVFTTQISGATITGDAGEFTSGVFTSLSGTTATVTSGVFASGTAAAPSVSVGTTDNGLYSPGTDEVAISTNGTGRLFVDASGNVGINAGSPTAKLTVYDGDVHITSPNDGTAKTLQFRWLETVIPAADSTIGGIEFYSADSSNPGVSSAFYGYGSAVNEGSLVFFTGVGGSASEKARITSDGKLGLGTSSPGQLLQIGEGDTGVSLNVHTIARIEGRAVAGGEQVATLEFNQLTNAPAEFVGASIGIESSAGTRSESELVFKVSQAANTSATEAMRLSHDGRLGIGTTSPAVLLTVAADDTTAYFGLQNEATATSGSNRASFGKEDPAGGANGGNLVIRASDGTTDGDIVFNTAVSAERARIDSSGRLLVGTSSSTTDSIAVFSGIPSSNTGQASISLQRGSANPTNNLDLGYLRFQDSNGSQGAWILGEADGDWASGDYPGRLVFSTTADGASTPTERMSISNEGYIFPDSATRAQKASINSTANQGFRALAAASTAGVRYEGFSTSTGTAYHIAFSNPNGIVGSISTNASATAYNTSSDYRLKENVVPLTGAADRVNQLQVHRFNFIADPDTTVDGFLAHEAQAVVPECVTGTKDEVDDDGNPVYQGIDQSKLVPLLTAALQEALTEIESLKARLDAANL